MNKIVKKNFSLLDLLSDFSLHFHISTYLSFYLDPVWKRSTTGTNESPPARTDPRTPTHCCHFSASGSMFVLLKIAIGLIFFEVEVDHPHPFSFFFLI